MRKALMFGGAAFQSSYLYFTYTAILQTFYVISDEYDIESPYYFVFGYASSFILTSMLFVEDMLSINPAEAAYELGKNEIVTLDTDLETKDNQTNSDMESTLSNREIEEEAFKISDDEDPILQDTEKNEAATESDFQNIESNTYSAFLIQYPLKWFSALNAHMAFITYSFASSLPIISPVPTLIGKMLASIIPIIFGTVYFRMLAYKDVIYHSKFIYSRFLSFGYSSLLRMIRSPLFTLELTLSVGSHVLLRSAVLSYIFIQYINTLTSGDLDKNIYPYFIFPISFSTAYTTLFSRLLSSFKVYFSETLKNFSKEQYDEAKKNFSRWDLIFNSLLRVIRSVGISYYIQDKLLPYELSLFLKIPFSILIGTLLSFHGIYVSLKRAINLYLFEQKSNKENDSEINKKELAYIPNLKYLKSFISVINIGEKTAATMMIFAAFWEVNRTLESSGINSNLDFTDIAFIALSIAIPVMLNSYDFYNQKMIENAAYYIKKYKLESSTNKYGKFMCFFKSIKEYSTEDQHESEVQKTEKSSLLFDNG